MLLGWSMTKSILNALIGIRVRQGELAIDQKALFPEWCERPEDARCNITVLELLQMSSGLHFDETYGAFGGATHMLFANTDVANFALAYKYDEGASFQRKYFPTCSSDFEQLASDSTTLPEAPTYWPLSFAARFKMTLNLRISPEKNCDFTRPRVSFCFF